METLALEPYNIPRDDTDSPVGRAGSATARIALVVVPFLMRRGDEISKLRPPYSAAIFEEAMQLARTERGLDVLRDRGAVLCRVWHAPPAARSLAVGRVE